jgi:glyoxylase-like metal-dependent hydrolase (beta-lactamase superfamily II)
MLRTMRRWLIVCFGVAMISYADDQEHAKLVKIRDFIYMAQTTSNVYLVTTPAGDVVIDTAPKEQAADAKNVLAPEVHGPVKYIILTHGHADHIGGIDLWKEAGTQIIAQRNYVEFVNYVTRLEGFFVPRNAIVFNRPAHEVGAWAGNYGAKIDPNVFFDENIQTHSGRH